jgi:N-acetylglutamate synthase-like GNAT family acetyltransferase
MLDVSFINDEDIRECNDFHNQAYATNRSLTQWHWQFDNLLGGIRPFVVAKENGRIVGTQALMPIVMHDASGDILTAKSEETLVDPSMRGKGLFQKMYEPLMKHALTNGVKAVWGFTPASKAFEGVGFFVPDRTSQLVCPLSSRAASTFGSNKKGLPSLLLDVAIGAATLVSSVRIGMANSNCNGIKLVVLTQAPAEAGSLCRDFVRGWGGSTILRDQAYLKWRYYDNPVNRATLVGAYRGDTLVGWLAYSLDDSSVGYVVDTLVLRSPDAEHILHALMLHATLALRSAGAVAIRSWHLNNHAFDLLILKVACRLGFYFVKRGEPVVLYLPQDLDGNSQLRSWHNWFITRAYTQGEVG